MVLLGSHRLVPSSQTFEPTANGTYCGFSFIQDSCALHWASWAAFLASLMDESRCSREGMVVFWVGWCSQCCQFYILDYSNGNELKCT